MSPLRSTQMECGAKKLPCRALVLPLYLREELALRRADRHPREDPLAVRRDRIFRGDSRVVPELADDEAAVRADRDPCRACKVRPLRDELALQVEDLHPVVLPVRDVERLAVLDQGAVGQAELPRLVSRRAPRREQLAARGEPVDARVRVPVRDVELACRVRTRRPSGR